MKISILGTEYEILKKKYDEDEAFSRRSIGGYCDGYLKQIVYCDMTTYEGWDNETEETAHACEKGTLRHEIVHAFFDESGLSDNTHVFDKGWARNEEMTDWIALQGPKIYAAWVAADAV